MYLFTQTVYVFVLFTSLRASNIYEALQDAYCCTVNEDCECQDNHTINFETTKAGGLPFPEIICIEENLVYFKWKLQENTVYVFEIMRQEEEEEEEHYCTKVENVTENAPIKVENLLENATYSIRLWSLNFDNPIVIVNFSDFQNVTTKARDYEPLPPKNVTAALKNNSFQISIEWEPNDDLSCSYEIIVFGGDSEVEQLDVEPKQFYEMLYPNVQLNSNYSIAVRAKSIDGTKESDTVTQSFITPTCLEVWQDLNKCVPEKPRNLSVIENVIDEKRALYTVRLKWIPPILRPDFYMAYFVNIMPKNYSNYAHLNISGYNTSAVFEKIRLGTYYQVKLVAWSKAGPSEAVFVDRHVVAGTVLPKTQAWPIAHLIPIIIGPLLFLIIVAAILISVGHYKSKRQRFVQRCRYFKDLEQKFTETAAPQMIIDDTIDDWELKAEMLHLRTILGEGAFGIVRRGYVQQTNESAPLEVAVKMLKEAPTIEEIRQFHSEIDIMKSVGSHPHLVSIIGCITKDRPNGPLLIVEYCSNGDLQTFLRNIWDKLSNRQAELEYLESNGENFANNESYDFYLGDQIDFSSLPKELLSYARQICVGMEYLSNMRVVHRDLAARNVLVCEDGTVKVSDFGLSRDIYTDNVYYKTGGGKLPMRWMALESLTHHRYTTQSDVWSFGILLWEIVTLGASPYPGVAVQDLVDLLKNGYRMDKPINCSQEIYSIMRHCWHSSPKLRPTFTELKASFETLLESVTQYLELGITSSSSKNSMYLSFDCDCK